jgi:hypothetical protein
LVNKAIKIGVRYFRSLKFNDLEGVIWRGFVQRSVQTMVARLATLAVLHFVSCRILFSAY